MPATLASAPSLAPLTPAETSRTAREVRAFPRVVGADAPVPLDDGRRVPYANLDYAASAPCLEAVHEAVTRALPYYSSVHRGAGYASQVTTEAYESARETVRGGRPTRLQHFDKRPHQRPVDEIETQRRQCPEVASPLQPAVQERRREIVAAMRLQIHHQEGEVARDINPAQGLAEFDAIEQDGVVSFARDVIEV